MLQTLSACHIGQAWSVGVAGLRVALLDPACLLPSAGTTLLAWCHEDAACHHPAVLASAHFPSRGSAEGVRVDRNYCNFMQILYSWLAALPAGGSL